LAAAAIIVGGGRVSDPSFTSLVTGGCGFVGRHLVHRLLERGDAVWIVDDLSTGLPAAQWLTASQAARVRLIEEDLSVTLLRQLGKIPGLPPRELPHFDYVCALASVVGGRALIDGDPLAVGVDLALDALFFLWLSRHPAGIGRVLYASSSAAYPTDLQTTAGAVALREDMIEFALDAGATHAARLGQPDMTYGWSKLTGEYLARLAALRYGLKVACVRPFSGFGGDQDLTYPVPAIAYRVARGDDPVTVWGTGEQGRDFVHIEDCITAMLRAVDLIADGGAVNIGTGQLTTFLEVAALLVALDGRNAGVRPLIGKPVGVQSRYCDPTRSRAILNWRPELTLEQGMAEVLAAAHQRVQRLGTKAID